VDIICSKWGTYSRLCEIGESKKENAKFRERRWKK